MSEDRTLVVRPQSLVLLVEDEDRSWTPMLQVRVLTIEDDERALEVKLP